MARAGCPPRPATGARGGGKGGTGGGKGGPGGGGKGAVTGSCFHCGKPGHRRSECPEYTAFLKGGGARAGALNQVTAGWGGELEEDANADSWMLGDAEGDFAPVLNGEPYLLNSLTAEVPLRNSFAVLASCEEEGEASAPAIAPVPPCRAGR